jgi:hypothetical protein
MQPLAGRLDRSRSGCPGPRRRAGSARTRRTISPGGRTVSAVVVDCRPVDRRAPRDLAAFEATRQACVLAGWEYRLVGAPDPIVTANLRWLAGYRHPRYGVAGLAAALRVRSVSPLGCWPGRRPWVTRSRCCRCCSTCCGARTGDGSVGAAAPTREPPPTTVTPLANSRQACELRRY